MLFGVVVAVSACVPTDPAPYMPSATERINEVLRAAVRRQDVMGVVGMATDRLDVLYAGAFGTADDVHDDPMKTDHLFRIASVTKAVTSVAAMQLVERGLVGLDDPVLAHLPEFAGVKVIESFDNDTGDYALRPAATTMTVRHLLTHTAGFGYAFTNPVVRDLELLGVADRTVGPLVFDPGTEWLYGANTDWVGRLIEAVSGQTLEDYFRTHVFFPLRMSDTSYNVPKAQWHRTVTVHDRQPDGSLVEQLRRDPEAVTTFSGGGGLWATAGDYTRFLRMLLNGGELDGIRVLAAKSVAEMSINQVGVISAGTIRTALPDLSNDFVPTAAGRGRFGLGFLINLDAEPERRAGDSLAWAGLFNTYFWLDPSTGVAGVFLTQILPFADPRALATFEAFERGVYELVRGMS